MSVFFLFFVALAFSLLLKKRLYETVVFTILLESVILYLSNLILESLLPGFFALLALNALSFVFCIFLSITNWQKVKQYVFTAECAAFWLFLIFFAIANIGRGFIDYDDYVCWGLEVKNMYIHNQIYHEAATTQGFYPPAIMCWHYLACKTWPFGYTESAILWAYDFCIVACLFPLFRYVKGKQIPTFIIILGLCILLPLSLTSPSYPYVLSRLCSDVILGVLIYYSMYIIDRYVKHREVFYFIQLIFILYAITLAKRLGITWTIFPLLMFMYGILNKEMDNKERIKQTILVIIAISIPIASYISWSGFSIYALIPIIVVLPYIVFRYMEAIKNLFKKCYCIFIIILFVLCMYGQKFTRLISRFQDDSTDITVHFFNSIFSNTYGGYGNIIKLSIFFACFIAILWTVFYYDKYMKNCCITGIGEKHHLYLIVACIVLNLFMLFGAYLTSIGLDPYWDGLPAFERYTSPYFLLIVLWFAEVSLCYSQISRKALYMFCIITVLEFADIGDFTNFILDKYPQLEYAGLDNSGIQLTENDKVYYVNHAESIWYNAGFYYYICPARCNEEGVIGYNEDNGTVKLTEKEFEKYLIDGQYDYLYIRNLYDAFVENYSGLFVNSDDIHDNCFYKVEVINGNIRLTQL